MYVHILYCRSGSLHAGVQREAQGSYTCWPHKVQQMATLHAVSDHARWWNLALQELEMSTHSKAPRAFSINLLLNVVRHDMQWGCGVGCPVWTPRANFCVFHPKQRASDTTCCGSQRHQNLSEPLREKQEEPRKSRSAISTINFAIPCPLSAPLNSLLPPVGYFVLFQVLESLRNFFYFFPWLNSFGVVAQLSPWQHWLANSCEDGSSSWRMTGSTYPLKLAHTKNNNWCISRMIKRKML